MWCRKSVCLSALCLVSLFAQLPGRAQSSPPNALPFFKNYFITGDYRVGSVDLSIPAGNFATGDIHFNDALGNTVPANADIVAAFLYWEMITLQQAPPNLAGARFRDQDISAIAKQLGPAKRLTKETSPCWTGGSGDVFELRGYRADVLRFLHVPVGRRRQRDWKAPDQRRRLRGSCSRGPVGRASESSAPRGVRQSRAVFGGRQPGGGLQRSGPGQAAEIGRHLQRHLRAVKRSQDPHDRKHDAENRRVLSAGCVAGREDDATRRKRRREHHRTPVGWQRRVQPFQNCDESLSGRRECVFRSRLGRSHVSALDIGSRR